MPRAVLAILTFTVSALAAAQQPIPVGYDAFTQWHLWPMQRIGMRTYMRSTYDRAGGNESADASHFLYEENGLYYPLDIMGKGILAFVRFNHWHGSPWTFEVDRNPYRISETATADPLHLPTVSQWIPSSAFPEPLAYTWTTTQGADLSWIPIPFSTSFRLAYGRTHYGTGYYIFHKFVPGTSLSQSITPWSPRETPKEPAKVIVAKPAEELGKNVAWTSDQRTLDHKANSRILIWSKKGSKSVRLLQIEIGKDDAAALEKCRLQIRWDHRQDLSVDVPVSLFFGAGTLFNRDKREWLVKAMPVSIRETGKTIRLSCVFPMPFFRSAEIAVKTGDSALHSVRWTIKHEAFKRDPALSGYFHATYRDHPKPTIGKDLVLLDTRHTEGSETWTGSFIGTSLIFSDRAFLPTLEGDPRFFFDDSQTPQAQGTGTEEWCGGGDYWGGKTMTLPFAGHPTGAPSPQQVKEPRDAIESAYRFLLSDLMPFGKRAVIRLEHGGVNETAEHYQAITYWYGLPSASLVKTDQLDIGSSTSERAHKYRPRGESFLYKIESRYEWGIDRLPRKVLFPETKEVARSSDGSEFSIRVDPANKGVMLRRTLDYQAPDQKAEVFVKQGNKWAFAGIWYLAGSNKSVYSNPPGELDEADPDIRVSNRRFRDDEFLLGKDLTKGKSSLRIRIVSRGIVRVSGHGPIPIPRWTEIRYSAYSFVTPKFSSWLPELLAG